jgi:APA family basic amino acid/polyamine antiporter
VTLAGVGVILGAGVYALVGPAAALAGPGLWLAFLTAGAAAGLTAYSYGRLGAMVPKDSPEFQYTALAFGPRVGFVAGWLMLAADLLAVATVALGFGGYLAHLTGTPPVAAALALVLVAALVAHRGILHSVGLASTLTVVEVAGLVGVIAIGLPSWRPGATVELPAGLTGLSQAAALIFFAYLGFDEIGNFAEEMRRPERDLPRAVFWALAVSTAIYLLVGVAATAAVPWQALAGSTAPLALVARQGLGARAEVGLAVVALAATANTVLLLLVAGSRSVYGLAAAGMLPGGLARVGRRGTPVAATLLVAGVVAGLTLVGDLARAAALTDAAVLLSFLLVNLSLPRVALRGRAGGARVRGADLVVPALALLLCGWLLLHTGPLGLATAAGLAGMGWALGRPRARR